MEQRARLKQASKHEDFVRALLADIFPNVRCQPGSGSQATAPNDVKAAGECMVEAKCTANGRLSVQLTWLKRARQLAAQFGLPGFVAIRFCAYPVNYDYFIVSADDMAQFLRLRRENEELRASYDMLARRSV